MLFYIRVTSLITPVHYITQTEEPLLKKQKGKCTHCGHFLRDGDLMEMDHITPKSLGGNNSYNNLQLLHRHCHDEKTANDGSLGNKSDCNSVKPEPPIPDNYIWVKDMLVMT
jgi:5-methylcytosine-specific restriction endonuclease McrA